jgi:hypothetical protein
MHAKPDQRKTAEAKPAEEDLAGADMIGEIADRRLRQAGNDGEHGQRQAEFDIADAELGFQERKQHRQHKQMEMAEPMRDRNSGQRAQRAIRPGLLRCGQNIDHVDPKTPTYGPARLGDKYRLGVICP